MLIRIIKGIFGLIVILCGLILWIIRIYVTITEGIPTEASTIIIIGFSIGIGSIIIMDAIEDETIL